MKRVIALDAMGGAFAPNEVVAGVLAASNWLESDVILVGIEDQIKALIPGALPSNLSILHASEIVTMDDKPVDALRKKKDSSLSVAVELVKEGKAQAMVSAGNTGAATAASLLSWRQVPGIKRPAIATQMPRKGGSFLLLDAGASPDVEPEQIVDFARMGRAYARAVMGIPNAKVHLMNMGEEPGKGNAFAKQSYSLLQEHEWFAGNIEGKDLPRTDCEVVVCDAFVGNIILKTAEGVAEFIMGEIREAATQSFWSKVLFSQIRPMLAPLKKTLDYAEYGGSPLLGLNGLCMICHGRSNARAIESALHITERALKSDLVGTIARDVSATAVVSS
jgi:phosphate acyltransferase